MKFNFVEKGGGQPWKGGSRRHVFKGQIINLVKFNFEEKGGFTGKRGVQMSSACGYI